MYKTILIIISFLLFLIKSAVAEKIDSINILGNERISKDTIIIFGEIDAEDDFNEYKLNQILKNLYDTNFFKDVKINLTNKTLNIKLVEHPIIQNIEIQGIKANKMKDPILDALKLILTYLISIKPF